MSLVVCRIQPAINAAYQANAEILDVSLRAVYGKIDRVEPGRRRGAGPPTAPNAGTGHRRDGRRPAPLLPGYRIKILDGNHLAGTEHRIKELRTMRAGALPGQTLVVLDPELMLVMDVIPCEDGHAQERSLLDQVMRASTPANSGSRTATSARRSSSSGSPGVRRSSSSASMPRRCTGGSWESGGRVAGSTTGKVFEQTIRATNDAGEILILRRVTVVLDQPTRDGDTEIHLLTNVPAQDARASVIAELYRRRWTIETAFAEMEATLNGEMNTLGYPKAALFAFCVALVAYNVMSTIKAALRSVHGEKMVAEEVSGYYVAEEIQMTHRGMMIAIPEDEWVVFQE